MLPYKDCGRPVFEASGKRFPLRLRMSPHLLFIDTAALSMFSGWCILLLLALVKNDRSIRNEMNVTSLYLFSLSGLSFILSGLHLEFCNGIYA